MAIYGSSNITINKDSLIIRVFPNNVYQGAAVKIILLNISMSTLKKNTGGLSLCRECKDQSVVKRNGHLHSRDHCLVRWWSTGKDKRVMYKLWMLFPALGLYVSFSSDSTSGCFELSQAEDRERLLAAVITILVSLEEWRRQKGQLREWPWICTEGTGWTKKAAAEDVNHFCPFFFFIAIPILTSRPDISERSKSVIYFLIAGL